MKFPSRSNVGARRADGYPLTDDVLARRVRKSNKVVLKNGSNLFWVDQVEFKRISVSDNETGPFELVGHNDSSVGVVLASFGSRRAAKNALDQLAAVTAGFGRGIRWTRWAVAGVMLFTLVSLLNGAVRATVAQDALKAQASTTINLPEVASGGTPSGVPGPSVHDGASTEKMSLAELSRLANGGAYTFNPKIDAPVVKAPQLACDTPAK